MRLHLLRLGSLQGDKGQVLTPGSGDGVSILIPVPAYLIETADGRRILVDTGSPRKYILDPDGSIGGTPFTSDIRVVMTERDDPVARLAEMGFAPSDIDIVVATHFHFDHSGNLADFGGARIVVQRSAYERAASGYPPYSREPWDLPYLRYDLIEGDVEIALPESSCC
jgi:N-acyl homoserine lactone hydrolase